MISDSKSSLQFYNSFPKPLHKFPNTKSLKCYKQIGEFSVSLSKSGEIYSVIGMPSLNYVKIQCPRPIIQISCNKSACLLVSSSGHVFSYGSDRKNKGFLGTGRFSSEVPELIPELSNIIQVSLGKYHAGALSDLGSFYMWGTCPLSNNTLVPSLYNSEMFSVQHFECGNNFTLILTPGGYLYVVGLLGFAHSKKNNSPGVVSPPELEKLSTVKVKIGKNLVVCLVENNDLYAFDGCMDIVKLPLYEYQKIEDFLVVDQKIVAICENNQIIEWKMSEFESKDICRIASFAGSVFEMTKKIKVIGTFENGIVVKAKGDGQIRDSYSNLTPYKRTEFGNKLSLQSRTSIKASIDLLKSVENSPVLNLFQKVNEKPINVLTFAINSVLRKTLYDIKIYTLSVNFKIRSKNKRLGNIALRMITKKFLGTMNQALLKFKLNAEIKNQHNAIKKFSLKLIFAFRKKIVMTKALNNFKLYCRNLVIPENKLKCFENIKNTLLRYCFLIREKKKISFMKLKKNLFTDYKLVSLVIILQKYLNFIYSSSFSLIFAHSNYLPCNILSKPLKSAANRRLKSSFLLIKNIFRLSRLENVVKSNLKTAFSLLVPRTFPTLLKFFGSLIKSSQREKLLTIKRLLRNPFRVTSHKETSVFSPNKPLESDFFPEKLENENDHNRNNTLTLEDLAPDPSKLTPSRSNDILEFKKYLLWWKEFQSKEFPKTAEKKNKNSEKKPPWRPSGVNLKKNEEENLKQEYQKRRREYSESLRSSKSSFSSEESFCRKIGWDKWEYIKKIRNRKSKDYSKLIGGKLIKRLFQKRVKNSWKIIKEYAKKNNTGALKKLVQHSWKNGVYSIGLLKIFSLLRKKFVVFAWKKVKIYNF